MSLSLDELSKVITSLKSAQELYHSPASKNEEVKKAFRDACIQRFEYCIELSWKISMKILGLTTLAPKPAIREMARNNLIQNPELWLQFIEARNETSHSNDEDIAEKVFKNTELFYPEAIKLIEILKKQI